MKRRYGAGIAVAAGAAAAGLLLARRWQLRWGATAQELAEPLPGDEFAQRGAYVGGRHRAGVERMMQIADLGSLLQ